VYEVLVFGFYGKNNVGDNLFCDAFRGLFPDFHFTFTDVLTIDNIKKSSIIFIGGGSFLSENLFLSEQCLNLLRTKIILYIGVGAETDINPIHKDLMMLARLIAIRSPEGIEKVKQLNENVIIIPDLVYSLYKKRDKYELNKSVLILPNICVVPQNDSVHWKYNSWDHFKFEFSQVLDYLVENEYKVNFLSMCDNNEQNDNWAAFEIINAMKHRSSSYILNHDINDIDAATNIFSKYDVIITQRYHGIILAELAEVPFIAIHHHDKLKHSYLNNGKFISYYSFDKQVLIDQFHLVKNKKIDQTICIDLHLFEELKNRVNLIVRGT
jgi:polysaccharide pyruvyl transferase WcaK-like protein